jgi:hypothetical protein
MRIVLPFISSNFFTSSCGDQHLRVLLEEGRHVGDRHAAFAHLIICMSLEPMMQSAWPAAISCMMLTCGPPILMVTSRPYFL